MKTKIVFLSFISMLCCQPMAAQLNGTGYYRFRNADRTGDYISMANDKFNYTTAISTACGGLTQAFTAAGQERAIACAGKYLETDIHVVEDAECVDPASVFYAKKKNTNASNYEYNLIGQGTSLLTLTTGTYPGTVKLNFENLYATLAPSGGSGAETLYTAKIEIQSSTYVPFFGQPSLGSRYLVDDEGILSIFEENTEQKAKWYAEPLTHFNVQPEVEFNGKFYTTMYVSFAFTLGDNVDNAYVITNIGEDGMLTTELVAANGEIVPAGTPVLLECSSNKASECKLIPTGAPLFTAPDVSVTANAPAASTATNYTGVNLLRGSYYCNQDGNMTFSTPGGTGSFNANNFITPTNPQKYVIGITESGKLGFVKAEGTAMPANKAWLEYAGTEELWLPFEEEAKPGDVTGDGNVDMADALAIVEIILGQAVEGDEHDYNFKAANVNEDEEGKITIADVVALLSKYLLPVSSEETANGPSATFMIDPGI